MHPARCLLFVPSLLLAAACGGGGGGGDPAVYGTDWVHVVTSENRVGGWTALENPLTFGRPELVLLVTQNRSPDGSTATASRSGVGVLYDADWGSQAPLGRWMIVILDSTLERIMPLGAAFNVSLFEPDPDAFVHRVTTRTGTTNQITHLPESGSPLRTASDTYVFATPRLTHLDGTQAVTNPHAVAARFAAGHWVLLNLDAGTMPSGSAFNVVMRSPDPSEAFYFNTLSLQPTVWTGTSVPGPSAILHVSQRVDTRGVNDRDVALRYSAAREEWGVENTDGSDVHAFAAFRGLIRVP